MSPAAEQCSSQNVRLPNNHSKKVRCVQRRSAAVVAYIGNSAKHNHRQRHGELAENLVSKHLPLFEEAISVSSPFQRQDSIEQRFRMPLALDHLVTAVREWKALQQRRSGDVCVLDGENLRMSDVVAIA